MEPSDFFLMQMVGGMIYHLIVNGGQHQWERQPTRERIPGQASRSSLEDWFARVDMLCADEAKGASWRDIV